MRKPRFAPYALTRLYRRASYLRRMGWFESYRRRAPVDAAGGPLPQYTYPAIELLAKRVPRDAAVFEYGSGYSTLWWAQRVKRVVSVEHDAGWSERIRAEAPANVTLDHVPLGPEGAYPARIREHEGQFDVIVIDGRERVQCAEHALGALSERGVLLWDDTNRERYARGIATLGARGFRHLPLAGMNPTSERRKETTVFYCDGNVLGL